MLLLTGFAASLTRVNFVQIGNFNQAFVLRVPHLLLITVRSLRGRLAALGARYADPSLDDNQDGECNDAVES